MPHSTADRPDNPEAYSMSFGDHLEELRRRILWALVIPLPLSIAIFMVSDRLIGWLYRPLDHVLESFDLPQRLQSLGPAEVLVVQIKLSIIFALVLSAPWILWQAWWFVRPGLYRHEQRFVYFLVPGSAILTATGVALMYFVMLPLMLQVLVMFGASLRFDDPAPAHDPRVAAVLSAEPDVKLRTEDPASPDPGDVWLRVPELTFHVAVAQEAAAGGGSLVEVVRVRPDQGSMITQEFRITTYINFVLLLLLGIVIAFQMPLVIVLLGWLGLVTPKELRAKRKYALFGCAVIAAVITPADALSMIIMLVPLAALYELSIILLIFAPASTVAEGTLWQRFGKK